MEEEEDVMMMMISTTSPTSTSENPTFPTWKLYQNPFYYSQHHHHHHHHHHKQLKHQFHFQNTCSSYSSPSLDLSIFNPAMEETSSEILELKAKLECERRARKKMESLNKRLAKELTEERRSKQELEKLCQELAREIGSIKREIDEEREMLRLAEVFREERVQMKLSEAKVFLEEKIQELEIPKRQQQVTETEEKMMMNAIPAANDLPRKLARLVLDDEKSCDNRGSSSEAENPHIKRGIKGFVEFPRVVRAIGSQGRSSRNWG